MDENVQIVNSIYIIMNDGAPLNPDLSTGSQFISTGSKFISEVTVLSVGVYFASKAFKLDPNGFWLFRLGLFVFMLLHSGIFFVHAF